MSQKDCPGGESISDSAFADIIQDVLDHLEETSEQNIAQEFQSLELESDAQAKPSRKAAIAPTNFRKNRYKDILPFDDNRIVLDDELGDDYINASMIQDHEDADFLIASQAPLPATVDDFWRMCWIYKVPCILMLCNLVENGRKKCEKYYPTNIHEPIETDHFWITLQKNTPLFDDLIVRVLIVTEKLGDQGCHTVKHVQYTSWPDFGISESLPKIEMLIKACQMNRYRLKEEDHLIYGYITSANDDREDLTTGIDSSKNPIIVHCSAGCGRTGTIACILHIVKLLETKSLQKNFNLVDLVLQMRQQRLSMVQNQAQYAFLIKFVHEYLLTRALEELRSEPQTFPEKSANPPSTVSSTSNSKLEGVARTPDEHSEYEMCWNSESVPPPTPQHTSQGNLSDQHEYINFEDQEPKESTYQEQDTSDDVIEENSQSYGPIPVINLSSSNPFPVDSISNPSDSPIPASSRSSKGSSQSSAGQKDFLQLKRVPAVREHRSVSPGMRKPQNPEMKEPARASVNLVSSPSNGSGMVHEYVMLSDCNSDAISTSDVINPIMCQESDGNSRTFAAFLMHSNSFRGGSRPTKFNQESRSNQNDLGSAQLRRFKSQENLYENME